FQAEDGIRDDLVTGVQTCALPIWPSQIPGPFFPSQSIRANRLAWRYRDRPSISWPDRQNCRWTLPASTRPEPWPGPRREPSDQRSEERRVGKECRLWLAAYPCTKQ